MKYSNEELIINEFKNHICPCWKASIPPLGSSTQVCLVVPLSVNPVLQVYVPTLPSSNTLVMLLPPLTGVQELLLKNK